MAASTLASLTPCLATRATIAARMASDISGRCDVGNVGGVAAGWAAALACEPATAAVRAECCAAFFVAVCGVATFADGARGTVPEGFSTTEDKDSGKRL